MPDQPAPHPAAPLHQTPHLNATQLRQYGRTPPPAFTTTLADGQTLHITRLLRVLPGKRIVGEGTLLPTQPAQPSSAPLLAKLFIDAHSTRRWQRERDGIQALTQAGIPTPALIDAQPLAEGGHSLLSTFLSHASTLLEKWKTLSSQPPSSLEALALLTPAFKLLGQTHAAGLSHDDLHFGNFLHYNNTLLLIDGDAVQRHAPPLPPKRAARDLAMLIAQLPRAWDTHLAPLLDAYHTTQQHPPTPAQLQQALHHERNWRLRDYLAKSTRDCTLFAVQQNYQRFTAVLRSEATALGPILDNPDLFIANGTLLKRGNTCTVAHTTLNTHKIVIKRYNLKNLRHSLSRLWRPSRAWHSWREAHRLTLFGIPTPTPLALIEERWGPLRRRAWLITAYCNGTDLLSHLSAETPPPSREAAALLTLFTTLQHTRISHGDLKATNLLWCDNTPNGTLYLIDLDAMRQHHTQHTWRQAWRRDRKRFLDNWPMQSPLYQWLDTHLPVSH